MIHELQPKILSVDARPNAYFFSFLFRKFWITKTTKEVSFHTLVHVFIIISAL